MGVSSQLETVYTEMLQRERYNYLRNQQKSFNLPLPLLTAYLLISHGSRDPRPQWGMEKLAKLVRDRLATRDAVRMPEPGDLSYRYPDRDRSTLLQETPYWQQPHAERKIVPAMVLSRDQYPLVGTATLELAPIPLHEQIRQFASEVREAGCNQLQLLPIFLLPGVHVTEDIPREVALARASLGQAVVLNQHPHLGSLPGLVRMLASQIATVDADAKILLSHGTRRPGGNESVEAAAKQLEAVAAYWSIKPTLEEQIAVLAATGRKQIGILPYFLFSGGITDAIAQAVSSLQARFPKLELKLAEPIGASNQLADLIVDLIEK
jgi:sirohydrochlorin cobaltochelatase